MSLSASIANQIRDEVGSDTDFVDNQDDETAGVTSLERIFLDENRGNSDILRTALIVWRRRLGDLQARSFDLTTEGSLLSRSQRVRFIERRIKELENLIDTTLKGRNASVIGSLSDLSTGTAGGEFSL